jgi:hypothetical protein
MIGRLVLALLVTPGVLAAIPQASSPKAAAPAAAAAASLAKPKPTLPSIDSVRVLSVERWDKARDTEHGDGVAAGLQQMIVIHVAHLDSLARRSTCQDDKGSLVDLCIAHPIALFLDGREIKGLVPESGGPEVGSKGNGTVRFRLARSPASDEVWADLLGEPNPMGNNFFHRPTDVSVGLSESYALPTDVRVGALAKNSFHLIRLRKVRFFLGLILFLVFLGTCYYLARNTNLLRDSGDPRGGANTGGKTARDMLKPYSLGRWQMAVWFVLVIGAFVFIWLVTGASDTITPTVLGLLGIGAATALGAAAIDNKVANKAPTKLNIRLREKAEAELKIAAIEQINGWETDPAKAADWASLTSLRDAADADIEKLMAVLQPPKSQGWWKDIITDEEDGYSFHRFQIFVWTIVLIFLFLISVWSRLSMPEFGATLLAVMGISGGTYLGFKLPENK